MSVQDRFKFVPSTEPDLMDDEYVLESDPKYCIQVAHDEGQTYYLPNRVNDGPDEYSISHFGEYTSKVAAMTFTASLAEIDK